MTFQIAKQIQANLQKEYKAACEALAAVTKGHKNEMGLTSDACKASYEYKSAKIAFNAAFQAYRNINTHISCNFKKEFKADQRAVRKVA